MVRLCNLIPLLLFEAGVLPNDVYALLVMPLYSRSCASIMDAMLSSRPMASIDHLKQLRMSGTKSLHQHTQ
eukprot:6157786-Amphidinium_carterae.1